MTDELSEIRERKREALVSGESETSEATAEQPVQVESEPHFRELAEAGGIVLVDFYADWCGPCKMLEPALETVAAQTDAVVAKVNIDQHQPLAQRHGVRGVPTLQLYVDGEPVKRLVGMQDETVLT